MAPPIIARHNNCPILKLNKIKPKWTSGSRKYSMKKRKNAYPNTYNPLLNP